MTLSFGEVIKKYVVKKVGKNNKYVKQMVNKNTLIFLNFVVFVVFINFLKL